MALGLGVNTQLDFGFAPLLAARQSVNQQHANTAAAQAATAARVADSQIALDRLRAATLPAQLQADVGRTRAQTANLGANTALTNVTAQMYPEDLRSQIGLRRAQQRGIDVTSAQGVQDMVTLDPSGRASFRMPVLSDYLTGW